jgi:hypothetical protein
MAGFKGRDTSKVSPIAAKLTGKRGTVSVGVIGFIRVMGASGVRVREGVGISSGIQGGVCTFIGAAIVCDAENNVKAMIMAKITPMMT